jgi:hypothetical protein
MRISTVYWTLGMAMSLVVGCTNPSQESWRQQTRTVNTLAHQLCAEEKIHLPTDELLSRLGKPDYVLTVSQLQVVLTGDQTHRDRMMGRLYIVYCQGCGVKSASEDTSECSLEWQDCPAFLSHVIWIYDESKHFSWPLYKFCSFCADTGYSAGVFFVAKNRVVASSVLDFWLPLKN